ncbi:MAG TPA: alkyl hydroperoxide reductase, partial [Verrucomicrobiota bacterium]|nr:alkyl hydroperoxide reductase [Verrucomicrobiota bacterium]
TGFVIPAGTADHPGRAEYLVTRDILLHELSPHMHYRGSRFRFDAVYPGGARETLVNVPYYRFDWQSLYPLAEPKRLPAGTRIVCDGGWDNSAANFYNPDPGQAVRFGEQSWEEMFIGYFNYTPAP